MKMDASFERNADKLDKISLSVTSIIVKKFTWNEFHGTTYEDVLEVMSKLNKDEKEKVLEKAISLQLRNLRNFVSKEDYEKVKDKTESFLSTFHYDKNNGVVERSGEIVHKIVIATLDEEEDISIIIKDMKENDLEKIDNEELEDSLVWILIRLIAIERCHAKNKN